MSEIQASREEENPLASQSIDVGVGESVPNSEVVANSALPETELPKEPEPQTYTEKLKQDAVKKLGVTSKDVREYGLGGSPEQIANLDRTFKYIGAAYIEKELQSADPNEDLSKKRWLEGVGKSMKEGAFTYDIRQIFANGHRGNTAAELRGLLSASLVILKEDGEKVFKDIKHYSEILNEKVEDFAGPFADLFPQVKEQLVKYLADKAESDRAAGSKKEVEEKQKQQTAESNALGGQDVRDRFKVSHVGELEARPDPSQEPPPLPPEKGEAIPPEVKLPELDTIWLQYHKEKRGVKTIKELHDIYKQSLDSAMADADKDPQKAKRAEEIEKFLLAEIEIENSVPPLPENQEVPPLPEQKETPRQTKEQALGVLSDSRVMELGQKQRVESFRTLTETKNENGEVKHKRHLALERKQMAYTRLEAIPGMRVIKGKEAIEAEKIKIIEKETEKIENKRYGEASLKYFEGLSEKNLSRKEKKEYIKEGVFDKIRYMEDKRGNLGISKAAFAEMILNNHLDLSNLKIEGLFYTQIRMPSSDGREPVVKSKKEFQKWLEEFIEPNAKKSILKEAITIANSRIDNGRKRVRQEKFVCEKEIIAKTVEEYKKQQEAERLAKEAQDKVDEEALAKRQSKVTVSTGRVKVARNEVQVNNQNKTERQANRRKIARAAIQKRKKGK